MGNWNATCGITQMPIRGGDRAVMVPLIIKQHDFLARGVLSGHGVSGIDTIAKPITLPLFGAYDNEGGLDLDPGQPGERYLLATLKSWASNQRLMLVEQGEPKPVAPEAVTIKMLQALLGRDLLVQVPNSRKDWLKAIRQRYDEASEEEKPGFAHYLPQLNVDIDAMPDMLTFALGVMMVPQALYESLVSIKGADAAVGYWDDRSKQLVEFKGTRREELEHWCTISKEHEDKIKGIVQHLDKMAIDNPAEAASLLEVLPIIQLHSMPGAMRSSQNDFFAEAGVSAALLDAGVKHDVAARDLWVSFTLFCDAMDIMRKHWAPQPAGGDPTELSDSAKLYGAAQAFVAQTIEPYLAK